MECPCWGDPCDEEGCGGTVDEYLSHPGDCCFHWIKSHGKEDAKKWWDYVKNHDEEPIDEEPIIHLKGSIPELKGFRQTIWIWKGEPRGLSAYHKEYRINRTQIGGR